MANPAKNRLEVQVVWPGGRWCMKGPVKGAEWTREQLLEQLRKAVQMIEKMTLPATPPPEGE